MKHSIKITFIFLCVALPSIYACSQPPAPRAGQLLAGSPGPGRTPPLPPLAGTENPDGPPIRPIQQLITVQGTIGAYTASDSMAYDGLNLESGGQAHLIRFAPHLAASLMATAKVGASLSVQGFYETIPEELTVIHLVSATAGGQTIYDGPPIEAANSPVETIQAFTGIITDLRRDRQGIPDGLILSGNRIIELHPGVYDQLQAYLKPGTSVSGSGSRAISPAGVVLLQNTPTIHPHTLTVNGQTYMIR